MLTKEQIRNLLRKWRRTQKEHDRAARREWIEGDKYASRRYEGIATASRWCCEDLEEVSK